jgi:hypothetical protein
MESDILEKIEWRVHPVTVSSFVSLLLPLIRFGDATRQENIAEKAMYFSELSVLSHQLVHHKPSSVAVACIMRALADAGAFALTSSFTRSLYDVYELSFNPESIESCCGILHGMSVYNPSTPVASSTHEQLDEDDLKKEVKDEGDKRDTSSPTSVAIDFSEDVVKAKGGEEEEGEEAPLYCSEEMRVVKRSKTM